MLKEVFVISEGILVFYYGGESDSTEIDQAILSSGLFSAIRDYSVHARSDALESFSTEKEYFEFMSCCSGTSIIVGVFDRKAPSNAAKEALAKIGAIFEEEDLIPEDGKMLDKKKTLLLRQQVVIIAKQLFGKDNLSQNMESVLSARTDIPLGFIVDVKEKKSIAHFARPKPLFKENQVREFLLLHSTLLNVLSKLGISSGYDSLLIESGDYAVSACRGGQVYAVTSGALRTPAIYVETAAREVCYETGSGKLEEGAPDVKLKSHLILFENGVIKHESGEQLPTISRIVISTLINNIDGFFRSINRRKFEKFEVTTSRPVASMMTIQYNKDDKSSSVKIFERI